LLPEHLDDHVAENDGVRVADVFVNELSLGSLGSARARPAKTGRPTYHPSVLPNLTLNIVADIQCAEQKDYSVRQARAACW
jgi:transposase